MNDRGTNDRGANDSGANDPVMKGRRNSWRRKLAGDRSGAVAVESAIVFGLLIVLTISLIEFSLALWQWNTAEKATELGVRYAVQSDPVSVGLAEYNGVTGGGLSPGTLLNFSNLDAFTLSCTNTSCSCSGAGCGDFNNSVSNPTGVRGNITAPMFSRIRELREFLRADRWHALRHEGRGRASRDIPTG